MTNPPSRIGSQANLLRSDPPQDDINRSMKVLYLRPIAKSDATRFSASSTA